MQIIINDVVWDIIKLSEEAYDEKQDETSSATTDVDDRTIEFRESCFVLNVIRHELFHAYYHSHVERYLPEDMEGHIVEEACCNIFEYHSEQINLLANFVLENYNKS